MAISIEERLGALEEKWARHIGTDFGATSQFDPHPMIKSIFRELHGPVTKSVNASTTFDFIVDFDEIIGKLLQAKLVIKISPVRSNVAASQTSTSGGGSTSGNGGAQTSSSGGAQTSSAGSSHTHSVSGQSAAASGAKATVTVYGPIGSNTGGPSTANTGNNSVGHTHDYSSAPPATTGDNSVAHAHSMQSHTHTQTAHSFSSLFEASEPAHTHTVSSTTSAAESAHTHSVSNHTHTVVDHSHTTPNHTHALTLTYGIYEGPTPSDPDITVTINGTDRTTALGGTWDADVELDVTQYLRTTDLTPIRGQNVIRIGADELCDVTLVLKSAVLLEDEALAGLLP